MFRSVLVCATVSLALLSSAALAAEPDAELRQACEADVQKFCPDVQPGGGAIAKCMRQHAFSLSRQCRTAAAHRRRPDPAANAATQASPPQ